MTQSITITGIGVGPGDPSLLTLAAIRAIEEADLIAAPTSKEDSAGRAESVVKAILPDIEVTRILFDMTQGPQGISLREQSAKEASRQILAIANSNSFKKVAFITLGDPNIYSTFGLMAKYLKAMDPALSIRSIPGVMAFQAVLSGHPMELTDEDDSLILLSGLADIKDIDLAAQRPDRAVVIYKGGSKIPEIKASLYRSGRLEGAIVGVEVGTATSRVLPLSEIDGPLPYLSTVVVPPLHHKGADKKSSWNNKLD
ncbi:precorrin-2/cobalt-factor-2 C20-methyltransferase [Ferrithrix thermotolerans DSM 19514]|jgi:precorrin-2/cobalt-factor-2 C20-methyltransferase|uniref:Precorrin-2/cobalt-factor-2 C20-methyltransferase n=1 Tax=Ferrithrix thermotolerans DSM 19514 TaxID=1121881 RepID=A0A1M4VK53_9ACTN|nr:precorrin-2 C(20)-methyltransferase [Ferrithrix thermotolerans]SHE69401.1 precorrin-2/cobalt-factor-2 C20-methyltransferase [Ferrithrix thermotolerans DSM 19514]